LVAREGFPKACQSGLARWLAIEHHQQRKAAICLPEYGNRHSLF